jgi:hypothetical protein
VLPTILGQVDFGRINARRATALAAALAALAAACTAPRTVLDNPAGHRVFVDGAAAGKPVLPFRYYGTSRWDALPADVEPGRPDWSLRVAGDSVQQPPPVSLWLFPLDFPLEAVRRAVMGREDVIARIELPPTPKDQRVDDETVPAGSRQLVDRAHLARISR